MSARLASLHAPVQGARARARVTRDPVPPGRVPVVLVHGMVASNRAVRPLLRVLGTHFPVYAPDLLGVGRVRSGASTRARDLGEVLLRWMDAVELEEATLLASSFGCQVAVEAAILAPERVRRLVLQGPTLDPAARSAPGALTRFLRNGSKEPVGILGRLLVDPVRSGTRRPFSMFRAMLREPIEDRIGAVRAPTLVISGERDPVAPPSWCQRLSDAMPDGRHTVLGACAHGAVYSSPEQLTRAVRPFLLGEAPPTRVDPPTGGTPRFIADLDSGSVMLRASSRGVEGEDFPHLGLQHALATVEPLGNRLPQRLAEEIYAAAGWAEGVPPRHLAHVRMEAADRWMVAQYPQRRYPAVLLGSASGAGVHLAAAMGAPFLPQTLLVPVRRAANDVDDLHAAMAWGRRVAPPLLEANPDHVLHHAHDPSHDRLMARHMAYFRLKRRRLGPILERFLATRLTPGATVFVLDCELGWPVTRVGSRHVFQTGGVGALTPEEYLHGGPRVAAFMRRRGRTRLSFQVPAPDETAPEAEWGFDPALLDDVKRVARERGLRVQRIPYDEPQDLSATVADLYRTWYARLGRPTWRLVAESFVLTDPTWALRTSSVPYWCVFAAEPAARALEDYLLQTPGFRELHVLLFSQGVDSVGIAPPDRWRDLVDRVGQGGMVGVDPRAFPRDFASLARYHRALERSVADRYPWPAPLPVDEVACFLAERAAQVPPRVERGGAPP